MLGTPLGFMINLAYELTGNYGIAIIVFAVVVRILIFPLIAIAHNNSIRFLRLQPELERVKRRYAEDKERLGEEQYLLFKQGRYSPLMGIVPLLLQLVIVVGVMQVLLNPPPVDLMFLGLDLDAVPSFSSPSLALLIPLFSGLAATVFCFVQNATSPATLTQSKATKFGTTVFIVILSVYLGLMMPVGVGIYWIMGNLLGILVALILYIVFSPKKLAPDAMAYIEANRKTPEELREQRESNKRLRQREKVDVKRFKEAKKQLVFYSLSSGQYKYYKNIIEYLLSNCDTQIHYLTNDENDAIFKLGNPKIIPYFASQKKSISLLFRLDADVFVTTVTDLQSYHMKRSIVRDDIEYIHIPHAMISLHMTAKEKAFDSYDTIFCVGKHQVAAFRKREEMESLPKKTLVKAGYGVHDQLVESFASIADKRNEVPHILIAPSWQSDCIMDICIDDILDVLLGIGYKVTVRPHPQYLGLYPEKMSALAVKYSGFKESGELSFGEDFADNSSIYQSDVIISDWSNIAYEFSYCTLKPSIFINTPMKKMNPNYERLGMEVLDITLRDKVGVSVDLEQIGDLPRIVSNLLEDKDKYREQIEAVVAEYLYYPGRNGEAGGEYIIRALKGKMV